MCTRVEGRKRGYLMGPGRLPGDLDTTDLRAVGRSGRRPTCPKTATDRSQATVRSHQISPFPSLHPVHIPLRPPPLLIAATHTSPCCATPRPRTGSLPLSPALISRALRVPHAFHASPPSVRSAITRYIALCFCRRVVCPAQHRRATPSRPRATPGYRGSCTWPLTMNYYQQLRLVHI